jgi:hypothetical protein
MVTPPHAPLTAHADTSTCTRRHGPRTRAQMCALACMRAAVPPACGAAVIATCELGRCSMLQRSTACCTAAQHVAPQHSTLQRSTARLAWCRANHGLRELGRARCRGGRLRLRLLHAALRLRLRVGHLRERCVRPVGPSCCLSRAHPARRCGRRTTGAIARA